MKNLILTILSLATFFSLNAQKFGYVDTEYILTKVPEYKEALIEIDGLSIEHQKKIDKMFLQVDSMINALQLEEPLLTDHQKEKRQTKITGKQDGIQEYQTKNFG